MSADPADSGLRLADLVAAFSLATDLGLGQPTEHVLRAWLIASRMADQLDLGEDARTSLFYVMTLAWVGCVADTPEVASWFGDDIAFRRDTFEVDLARLPLIGFSLRHVGVGTPPLTRLRLATNLVVTGGRAVERGLMSHCLTTVSMAERLGLGATVCDPLRQVFTRWDATGVPDGIGGEEISPLTRLYHLADVVEVHNRCDGIAAAVDVARSRRGKQFDPILVDTFCAAAGDVLDGIDSLPEWDALIDGEPGLQRCLSDDELDAALVAVADYTDLRSRSRSGHSRGVASLAAEAGALSGLPAGEVRNLRRAGLVHDIGLHGVPATILDKAGPLTGTERERLRMSAYYTERTLARPPALARIGAIASLACERMDGSGYHRGLSGTAIPVAGRILAAADVFHSKIEPRRYRPALSVKQASAVLRAGVHAGTLDAAAVDAVLAAAGQRPGKRRSGPAGLTPREVEVLTQVARGASTKQVAQALGITPRTAGTHIERIYTKIGASTRATATLYAVQHGLMDTLGPVDL